MRFLFQGKDNPNHLQEMEVPLTQRIFNFNGRKVLLNAEIGICCQELQLIKLYLIKFCCRERTIQIICGKRDFVLRC